MAEDAGDTSVLRAKYLDWCSARIADRFLRLPPEEIYELAHDVAQDPSGRLDREALTVLSLLGISPEIPDIRGGEASGEGEERMPWTDERGVGMASEGPGTPSGVRAAGGGGSYRELVARVAERLAARMELPTFEEWSAAYRAEPERYDRELLGFWRG